MYIPWIALALGLVTTALALYWARRYNAPAEWRALCCYVMLVSVSPLIGILESMGVETASVVQALRGSVRVPVVALVVVASFSPFLLRFVKRWGWKQLHLVSTVCLWVACLSVAGHALHNLWYSYYDRLWQQACGGLLVVLVMWWARRGIYRESPVRHD